MNIYNVVFIHLNMFHF